MATHIIGDWDQHVASRYMLIDEATQRIDRHRIEYAMQVVMERALGGERLSLDHWAGACLRVAMKHEDVRRGIIPPNYEVFDPAKLLQQFREHEVAKAYGYADPE